MTSIECDTTLAERTKEGRCRWRERNEAQQWGSGEGRAAGEVGGTDVGTIRIALEKTHDRDDSYSDVGRWSDKTGDF